MLLMFQVPQGTSTFQRSKKSGLGHKTARWVMPPSITAAYKCTMLVRHKMWGDDLLGRPECSSSSSILCGIDIFAADSGRGSELLAVGSKTTAHKSDPSQESFM